jgi:hypothetical protein
MVHYPYFLPVHLHPPYQHSDDSPAGLPVGIGQAAGYLLCECVQLVEGQPHPRGFQR